MAVRGSVQEHHRRQNWRAVQVLLAVPLFWFIIGLLAQGIATALEPAQWADRVRIAFDLEAVLPAALCVAGIQLIEWRCLPRPSTPPNAA